MKLKKLRLLIIPIILIIFTSCSSKPKQPVVNLCGNAVGISDIKDPYHDRYLIATLTFYDPETNWFAAAGHDVNNFDWNIAKDETTYELYYMDITGAELQENGIEYGLTGVFNEKIGVCADADDYGLYGYMTESFTPYGQSIPIANIDEIKKGPAIMYYTIEGRERESCEIIITYVDYKSEIDGLDIDFVIRDENFLEINDTTMAGMSGSPIIQDGKLIGTLNGCVLETDACIATFAITMYDEMVEARENYKGDIQK